ncbi:MAG: 2,3-bisphosphoglycerate-independent phosphoglycerate mutase [Crocinitomicaceae bacterium]|nr:2,3-bisphosphoglycerate-independent phosphoglycerate mutase [Crocinitomicaceae bacterium]
MNKKVGLIILDGWGIGDQSKSDAIYHSNTPFMDQALLNYPNSSLITCGEAVGLPAGQMGNSEVGHLNIGAGRIVYQELSRINNAIKDRSFFSNQTLLDTFEYASNNQCKIHLLGLVSHGGVHSSMNHLEALIDLCLEKDAKNVFIHTITDGRDCDPQSAIADVSSLEHRLTENIKIATVIGRYYAMDRDRRWERVEKAYNLYVKGEGNSHSSAVEAIKKSYEEGITDEFINPVLCEQGGLIEPGDVVISFNFRTDRPREIAEVLSQREITGFDMKPLALYYVTMTNYDDSFSNMHVVFQKDHLNQTLGEVLAAHGKTQVRIAETEKYPHVTYFFNGGREEAFENETRLMINSPKVATYDLKPEMSAKEITSTLISHVKQHVPDFFCLNFANPDMVGHTGVYEAIVKAVETVDRTLQEIIETLLPLGYAFIVIADHGNADYALNPDGTPNTAHSLNNVPCVLIGCGYAELTDGLLADVAPTVLALMELTQPAQMSGKSLIKKGA